MDHAKFFARLRARDCAVFGTSLSQKQVDGLNVLLAEADKRRTPLKWLAYILATAYHETAHTMQPIAEYGKGKGRKYGVPAGPYGQVYYGRGYVQLTWLENYQKASKKIGVDLVPYPDRAMEPRIAALILFAGMGEGWFTGKKLSDYITDAKADYTGARRIVNGVDRAGLIAKYAVAFESALTAAGYTVKTAQKPAADAPKPTPAPSQPKAPQSAPESPKNGKAAGVLAGIILALVAAAAYLLGG